MTVRPYIFYKREELDALQKALEVHVFNWAHKWFPENNICSISKIERYSTVDGDFITSKNKYQMCLNDEVVAEYFCNDKTFTYLAGCLLNKKSKSLQSKVYSLKIGHIEEKLVHAILMDFINGICASDKKDYLRSSTFNKDTGATIGGGEGFIMLTLNIGQNELAIVIPPELTISMISRDYKSEIDVEMFDENIKDLLTAGSLKCNIFLGNAQVSIDELVSLRVGDVIKLNKDISESIDMKFDGAKTAIKCVLGRSNDKKSVMII